MYQYSGLAVGLYCEEPFRFPTYQELTSLPKE
jgi:hypothetical protein